MSRSVILIGSSNGSSNLGDLAMWQAAATAIRRRYPHAEIHTDGHLTWDPGMSGVRVHPFLYPELLHLTGRRSAPARVARRLTNMMDPHAPVRRVESFVRGHAWSEISAHWLNVIAENPKVIFSGAGGINDEFAVHGVHSWSAIARRALLEDGDVALVGQGVGPLDNPVNRTAAQRFLRTASLITTRDEESRDVVSALAPSTAPVATPDWALLLDVGESDRASAQEAIERYAHGAPFDVVSFHHWRASSSVQRDSLAAHFRQIVSSSAARGRKVLGVANAVSSGTGDDRNFMKALATDLPREIAQEFVVVDEVLQPTVVKALLGAATTVFSTRYHPVVFALGEGTPALPLHFDEYYRQKMEGALRWYGEGLKSLDVMSPPDAIIDAAEELESWNSRQAILAINEALRASIEEPLHVWIDGQL